MNFEDELNEQFQLRGFSLATLFVGIGALLVIVSFSDYVLGSGGGSSGIGGITFIYAFPALILGAALVYAEIQPAEVEVSPGAEGLFDRLATPTLKKVKRDVTRHKYGDDAHLDTSLKALGLRASTGQYPKLKRVIESMAPNGQLEFTMIFQSKDVPFNIWAEPGKPRACDRFFGPGIWTEIYKYDVEQKLAALKMTTGERPKGEEQ